jgi:hypothetical protein
MAAPQIKIRFSFCGATLLKRPVIPRLGEEEPNMTIIGVDAHPSFQQIAFVDSETGEYQESRLQRREEAATFYRDLATRGVKVHRRTTTAGTYQQTGEWVASFLPGGSGRGH